MNLNAVSVSIYNYAHLFMPIESIHVLCVLDPRLTFSSESFLSKESNGSVTVCVGLQFPFDEFVPFIVTANDTGSARAGTLNKLYFTTPNVK